MTRRMTALDRKGSPRWDPKKNAPMRRNPKTGEKERMPVTNPFTPEQKRRSEKQAAELRSRVDRAIDALMARLEDAHDTVELAEAIDLEAQFYEVVHDELIETRDELIKSALVEIDEDESLNGADSAALVERFADRLLLTASRIRQIKAKDNLGSRKGMGRGWRATEVRRKLPRKYLRAAYFEQGQTMEEIAAERGVDPQTVSNYLHAHFDDDPEYRDKFRGRAAQQTYESGP